jgi:hypothetical protein
MNELTATSSSNSTLQALNSPAMRATANCDECLGSGGWFRYEPALEPAPGMLYLSCLRCRGTGRAQLAAEARD